MDIFARRYDARQQRLWAQEETGMSKLAADPNDVMVQLTKAGQALRSIERRQKASFDRWSSAWKERKAEALADISEDVFRMLRAGNVVSAREEQIRNEAIKAKSLQDDQGTTADAADTESADSESEEH